MFMMSSGGLTAAELFQGKDAILSGPAGGVVGMAETGREAGFKQLIGFDMGGTSTDVSHYDGEYERAFETEVAGVRMRAPMMLIHTVAAGGGSILAFDGGRLRVGPQSAGADPGPACYRRGGPLTLTDVQLLLGRIRPERFPAVFGPDRKQALDAGVVQRKFSALAVELAAAGVAGRVHVRDRRDVRVALLRQLVERLAVRAERRRAHRRERGLELSERLERRPGARVLVSHPGRQHSHRAALALAQAGMLAGYWAGVPASEGQQHWIPGWLRRRLNRHAPVPQIGRAHV